MTNPVSGSTTRRSHVAALDGVRALAVLAVMLNHTWLPRFPGGWAGVDVFFVLSGYLITSLLLDEHRRTGAVSLSRFYARRVLRLLPAATTAIVVALFLAATVVRPLLAGTTHEAIATVLYVANWQTGNFGLLAHTWSLSLEEQFYIVWPIILLGLLRLGGQRAALAAALAGVATITVARFGVPSAVAYARTDTRGDALLIGCALALVVNLGYLQRLPRLTIRLWGCASVPVLTGVVLFVRSPLEGAPFPSLGYTVIALASAGVIANVAVDPAPVARALASPPMVWLGRRSYGVYLYHYPIFIGLVGDRIGTGPVTFVLTLFLALTAAALSYRYVEQPFLRMKDRWSDDRAATVRSPEPVAA